MRAKLMRPCRLEREGAQLLSSMFTSVIKTPRITTIRYVGFGVVVFVVVAVVDAGGGGDRDNYGVCGDGGDVGVWAGVAWNGEGRGSSHKRTPR